MELPQKILELVDSFKKIPGVGEKTALRYVMSLTSWDVEDIITFSSAVNGLCEIKKCIKCGLFSDGELCNICSSPSRKDSSVICVVEKITDCIAIEKSGQYKGKFHILGGVLNPLLGVGPDELKIDNFVDRINEESISEIILAINPSVEGDATCSYINQILPSSVEVQRIGFGIPMGGNLEYLDPMTIMKALENRKIMD